MIDIRNSQTKAAFTKKMDKLIRDAVLAVLEHEKISPRGVSVLITDDETIRQLNAHYRGMDKPTDVLSFPLYDENGRLDDEDLGDVVISLERACKQANEYNHSVEREVAFLTVHSVLHLLGYDHEIDETEMFEKQSGIMENILAGLHE